MIMRCVYWCNWSKYCPFFNILTPPLKLTTPYRRPTWTNSSPQVLLKNVSHINNKIHPHIIIIIRVKVMKPIEKRRNNTNLTNYDMHTHDGDKFLSECSFKLNHNNRIKPDRKFVSRTLCFRRAKHQFWTSLVRFNAH